jgi:alkylation response protein AidB-like acyl-CoA dehydrogenase
VAEAAATSRWASQGAGARIATTQMLAGELDTELTVARLAVKSMIDAADTDRIDVGTVNAIVIGRTLAAGRCSAPATRRWSSGAAPASTAPTGLERLFRDAQAARYHPLQEKPQALFTGRMALGVDVNE